jgi:hypothetical protein
VKATLICLILLVGQMNTMQDKPVVYLQPHHISIDSRFSGKLLELANAPAVINLPVVPPKADYRGIPWSIDVKNLGPAAVAITGKALRVEVNVGQSVHISSDGAAYSVKR